MSWSKEKPFNRSSSDLTDAEWERIQPLLEELEKNTRGRPREKDLRNLILTQLLNRQAVEMRIPVMKETALQLGFDTTESCLKGFQQ